MASEEDRPGQASPPPPSASKAAVGLVALALIFALALSVRLAWQFETRDSPLYRVPQGDARWHDEWARRIAAGDWTLDRPFFRAPLYPFFLAGIYAAGGGAETARIVQHGLGAVNSVLIALLAGRLFGRRAGWIAGGIAALYGPLIYFENELLIESLAVFLFTAALLALQRAIERPALWRWAGSGLLLGLCAIARPTFLLLPPVIVLWWLWRGNAATNAARPIPAQPRLRSALAALRRAAAHMLAFAAGVMLPVLPVTLHNRIAGGEWVLIATQGGVNFYLGNNPDSDGRTAVAWTPLDWSARKQYPDNVWWMSRVRAEQAVGRALTDAETSDYWYAQAWDFWRNQPAAAAALTLRKLYYVLNGFEIESNRSTYLDAWFSRVAAALLWNPPYGPVVPLGLVWPLAIVGMACCARRRPAAGLLRWLGVIYLLGVAAFFVTGRFRLPAAPVLILFAAAAVDELIRRSRAGGFPAVRAHAAALLLLLAFCNSRFFDVRTVSEGRQAAMLGWAYQETGQPGRALVWLEGAVQLEPDQYTHWAWLGSVQFQLGRFADAEASYRRSLDIMPGFPLAHAMLGETLLRLERTQEGEAALRRALSLDPELAGAHLLLADLLEASGDASAALQHREAARRLQAKAGATGERGTATRPSP